MVSLKNRSKGFTIVELLIVIVVIAILATLVIVTFTGIQQKARDSQRQTDINALDSHVEAFYAQWGFYPTLAEINDSDFRDAHMRGLDPEALKDPKGGTLAATVTSSAYGYDASGTTACTATAAPADNADGTPADTGCTSFTLTADLEGSTTNYIKKSN